MLRVNSFQEENTYHIQLEGEVNASTSLYLDQALLKASYANKSKILIDCQHLTHISSNGLGVLMSYLLLLKDRRCQVVLTHVKASILPSLQELNMDAYMTIVPAAN